MPLSSKNFRAVLDILDLVYSVNDRSAMFRAVCEKLQKIIPFCSAIFVPANPENGQMYFNGYEVFNAPESALILYLDHYQTLDPYASGGFLQTRNRIICHTDLVPFSTFKESEFVRDFLLPHARVFYCVAVTIASQGDTVGLLSFHRPKYDRDWNRHDKEVVSLLVPHLARAIRNLDLREKKTFLTDQKSGVIITGEKGKPVYMNETAKGILGKMPLDKIPNPGFGSGPVFFKRERKTYRVRTLSAGMRQKGKLILLERQPAAYQIDPRFGGFGLSPREEEVAALVIQGYTNGEIAKKLFISGWTVKDHLSSIFEKCKINRRSQLGSTLLRD